MKATHFHCREFEKFRKSVRKVSLITTTQRHLPLTLSCISLHFVSPVHVYVCGINELLFYMTYFCIFSLQCESFPQGTVTILKELTI